MSNVHLMVMAYLGETREHLATHGMPAARKSRPGWQRINAARHMVAHGATHPVVKQAARLKAGNE